MTRDETKKILMIIDATYPNFKVEDLTSMIDSWHFFLEEYEYQHIAMALKTFVNTSGKGFPPSVDQLIAMIKKPAQLTRITEQEAWQIVRKAIGRGNYYAEQDFDALPSEEIKRAVGSPAQIRIWATDSDFNEGVESSNFFKRYQIEMKRSDEISSMPKELRVLIQSGHQFLIEGDKK